ncbi:DUF6498-containing protein [Halorubrum halodurans]|nr:DUF6498-containing protein [Halorubrum halodurans]
MSENNWMSISDTVFGVLKESSDFFAGLVLNFALIIGVVVFQWNLVEIAVVYLIEIAIIQLFFFPVALFTPEPVEGRDGDAWDTDPVPIQPINFLPPVYWRNIRFVWFKAVFNLVVIGVIMRSVSSGYTLSSDLPMSLGLAIAGIVLFQLSRVWRYFIVDQSYREKSPTDPMAFVYAPLTELFLMLVYVLAPVTLILAGIAFTIDSDLSSLPVLLLYLTPIGFIRAWIGSLDPQTDDFEVSFS